MASGRAPEARKIPSASSSTRSPKTRRWRRCANPHAIDMERVNAQQARRILDRLVGYKISPLLWAKVRGGLSAGRVQSVAVELIVDREREIDAFVPREYWSITARLAQQRANGTPPVVFPAELFQIDGEKVEVTDGKTAAEIVDALEDAQWRVSSVKKREMRRNAAAPFTTSTMQQEASRKLKFRVRRTMQVAQALYEGVDLGGARVPRVSSPTCAPTRLASAIRRAKRPRVHRVDLRRRVRRRAAPIQSARRRARRARSDPPDVRVPHARLGRRRSQTRRAAAVSPDLGALRRLADGAGDLRPDDRRHGRRPSTPSGRPAA